MECGDDCNEDSRQCVGSCKSLTQNLGVETAECNL